MTKLKFLDSFVFRLALGYTALVVGVISLAFLFSYLAADYLLDQEARGNIQSEVDSIAARYHATVGPSPTAESLALGYEDLSSIVRARGEFGHGALYEIHLGGAQLAPDDTLGALMRVEPDSDGWRIATLTSIAAGVDPDAAPRTREVLALETPLYQTMKLVVGRDLASHARIKGVLLQIMLSGLGITIALGLLGGALAAQRMMRRVERARRAAEDIMTGDLKRRLPLVGYDDELERLTVTLNQMLDRIERLVGAMREVTDDVAHDLRTPLTRLRVRAERALQNPRAEAADLRAALEECVREADRLLAIFQAILSIARLKTRSGANAEHPEIDLSQAIADAAELYEPVLEEAGFALTLEIAPDLRVRGERALIGQAFANLIENALHYGLPPPGSGRRPEIRLRLARRGDRAEISVSDRGPGVPPDKREAVFSRFSRLDPSRAEDGVGLGLAFVRAVAESHGGSARIEDAEPGARVSIRLPLAEASAPKSEASKPAAAGLRPAETL